VDIVRIFENVANQMRSDFEKARHAVQHPGLKGTAFEETFRTFLRNYLPQSLNVSTGVIVDSHGGFSRQLDVIVSDTAKTPIFFSSGDVRVMPVEPVYAVIEVKSYLNTDELKRIFENMLSVRGLKKTAYHKPTGAIIYTSNLYGKEWDIWPINYYVFAYDSIKLDTLTGYIEKTNQEMQLPIHSRIDTVCVLDKGVICNCYTDNKLYATPGHGSTLIAYETTRSLLFFYTLTIHLLNQVTMPNLQFLPYLGKIEF